MAISTLDGLVNAMGNNTSRIVLDKANIASQSSGTFVSMWRATGQPGQGAIPAAADVCNNALTGAIAFTQQVDPSKTYGALLYCVSNNAAMTLEIHDRLMHMGGLSGTLTTAQTVGVDISANLASSDLAARIGDANYSDIQWWLEWYTATGATSVTATVAVTYNDGSTGTLSVFLGATRPAGLMIPLNGLIPAAASGKYIRSVNTVTLPATTGTAGSFGVTATRPRMLLVMNIANKSESFDWQALGLPEIVNSSCLFPLVLTSTTSSGTLRGGGKLIHG